MRKARWLAALPPDDQALEGWLKARPGVAVAYVSREASTLKITFVIVRNMAGEPPLPCNQPTLQ